MWADSNSMCWMLMRSIVSELLDWKKEMWFWMQIAYNRFVVSQINLCFVLLSTITWDNKHWSKKVIQESSRFLWNFMSTMKKTLLWSKSKRQQHCLPDRQLQHRITFISSHQKDDTAAKKVLLKSKQQTRVCVWSLSLHHGPCICAALLSHNGLLKKKDRI